MGRKPTNGYTARITYVPVSDAPQRYARALEILLRAKKRMEKRDAHGGRCEPNEQ